MQHDIKSKIEVLMFQAKAWAESVSMAFKDEISFRRIIISREIFSELKSLEKMLALSLDEMKMVFIARCAWRQQNKTKNITFAQDPETETNRLYFNIASLLFNVTDLKTLLSILMPNIKEALKITIPEETPEGISPKEVKECHQHDLPLLSMVSLDTYVNMPASIDNLKKCVFHKEMVFIFEDSPLSSLTLDWHIKCYHLIKSAYPGMAKKLYQHNEHLLRLKSDILRSKKGLSPAYVFKDLIWGLRLGGHRFTQDESRAGASAMTAISRFFEHYKQWPKSLRKDLGEIKILSQEVRNIKQFIQVMRKPDPVSPMCVEVLSSLMQKTLEQHKDNKHLNSVPAYTEDEIKSLYQHYRNMTIEPVKNTNLSKHYPDNIVKKVSTQIEVLSLEHFVWILKSISTNAYNGLLAGLLPKLLDRMPFTISNFAYAFEGELFDQVQKEAMLCAMVNSIGNDSDLFAKVKPVIETLLSDIDIDKIKTVLKGECSPDVAFTFISLIAEKKKNKSRYQYLHTLNTELKVPVFEKLLEKRVINSAPKFINSGPKFGAVTKEAVDYIMSLAPEVRAPYIAAIIRVTGSTVRIKKHHCVAVMNCIPREMFIDNITTEFERIGSILELSCQVKTDHYLESILETIKKHDKSDLSEVITKNTGKNILHCIATSSSIKYKFKMILEKLGKVEVRAMSKVGDNIGRRPLDCANSRGAVLVILQGYFKFSRLKLLKMIDSDDEENPLKGMLAASCDEMISVKYIDRDANFFSGRIPYHLAMISILNEEDAFTFSKMQVSKWINHSVMFGIIQEINKEDYTGILVKNSRPLWFYCELNGRYHGHFLNRDSQNALITKIQAKSKSWNNLISNYRRAYLKDLISPIPRYFEFNYKTLDVQLNTIFNGEYNPVTVEEIINVIKTLSSVKFFNEEDKCIRIHALLRFLFKKIEAHLKYDFLIKNNNEILRFIIDKFDNLEMRWIIVETLLRIYEQLSRDERTKFMSIEIEFREAKTSLSIKALLGNGVLFIPEEMLNSPELAFSLFMHLTNIRLNYDALIQKYGANKKTRVDMKEKVREKIHHAFVKVRSIQIKQVANIIREYYQFRTDLHFAVTRVPYQLVEKFTKVEYYERLLQFSIKPFDEKVSVLDCCSNPYRDAFFKDIIRNDKYQHSPRSIRPLIDTYHDDSTPRGSARNLLQVAVAIGNIILIEELILLHNIHPIEVLQVAVRQCNKAIIDHVVMRNIQESELFYEKYTNLSGNLISLFISDAMNHALAHEVLPRILNLGLVEKIDLMSLYHALPKYISAYGSNLYYFLNFLVENGFDLKEFDTKAFDKSTKTLFEIILERHASRGNVHIQEDGIQCMRLLLDQGVSPLIWNKDYSVYERLTEIFPSSEEIVLRSYQDDYELIDGQLTRDKAICVILRKAVDEITREIKKNKFTPIENIIEWLQQLDLVNKRGDIKFILDLQGSNRLISNIRMGAIKDFIGMIGFCQYKNEYLTIDSTTIKLPITQIILNLINEIYHPKSIVDVLLILNADVRHYVEVTHNPHETSTIMVQSEDYKKSLSNYPRYCVTSLFENFFMKGDTLINLSMLSRNEPIKYVSTEDYHHTTEINFHNIIAHRFHYRYPERLIARLNFQTTSQDHFEAFFSRLHPKSITEMLINKPYIGPELLKLRNTRAAQNAYISAKTPAEASYRRLTDMNATLFSSASEEKPLNPDESKKLRK